MTKDIFENPMSETLELIDFSTCLQNLTIPCITTFKCLVYRRELLKQIKASILTISRISTCTCFFIHLTQICSRIFFVCSFNIVMHSSKFGIGPQTHRPSINLSSFWVPSWILKAEEFLFFCHRHQREEERNIISCSSQLLPSNGSNSLFPHQQKRVSYSNLSDLTGQSKAKKVWFMDSQVSPSPRFNNKSWYSDKIKQKKCSFWILKFPPLQDSICFSHC